VVDWNVAATELESRHLLHCASGQFVLSPDTEKGMANPLLDVVEVAALLEMREAAVVWQAAAVDAHGVQPSSYVKYRANVVRTFTSTSNYAFHKRLTDREIDIVT